MTPQDLAERSRDALYKGDHATQHLNIKIESVAPGECVLHMEITKQMVNGHGTCHGGYIFTLGDSALAFSCNTYGVPNVAQSCHITYINPGHLGDVLTARAKEVSRRGRSGVYDVAITNQKGEQIAEFRGLCRTIKGSLLEA